MQSLQPVSPAHLDQDGFSTAIAGQRQILLREQVGQMLVTFVATVQGRTPVPLRFEVGRVIRIPVPSRTRPRYAMSDEAERHELGLDLE